VSRRKKDPLRPFTGSERRALEQLARSNSAPALSVARARTLLAVSRGSSCTQAAQLVGRTVGDSIAQWVTLFNQVGLRRWNGSLVVDHQPSTVQRSALASVVGVFRYPDGLDAPRRALSDGSGHNGQ
jgi:hypothetical protein